MNLEKYAFDGSQILKAIKEMVSSKPGLASSIAGGTIGAGAGAMTGDGGYDNMLIGALLGSGAGAGASKLKGLGGAADDIFASATKQMPKGGGSATANAVKGLKGTRGSVFHPDHAEDAARELLKSNPNSIFSQG